MTNPTTPTPQTFDQVFERQGIEEQFRTTEHFFFEQGNEGEVFAVPREILVEGRDFIFNERGQVIHPSAHVHTELGNIGVRTIIGPTTIIQEDVEIGEGAVIGKSSLLQMGATVGDHTVVGRHSRIDRDASVGEWCDIFDDVAILSNATIADNVIIERGAKIRERVNIGRNCRVLADTIVSKSIRPNTLVYNNRYYNRLKRGDHS